MIDERLTPAHRTTLRRAPSRRSPGQPRERHERMKLRRPAALYIWLGRTNFGHPSPAPSGPLPGDRPPHAACRKHAAANQSLTVCPFILSSPGPCDRGTPSAAAQNGTGTPTVAWTIEGEKPTGEGVNEGLRGRAIQPRRMTASSCLPHQPGWRAWDRRPSKRPPPPGCRSPVRRNGLAAGRGTRERPAAGHGRPQHPGADHGRSQWRMLP
jgi:hypothetical protein